MKTFSLLRNKICRFLRENDGAAAIEYAIIAGLIAVAIIVSAGLVGDEISELFTTIQTTLSGIEAPAT